MSQVTLKSIEDLSKLKGFRIEEIGLAVGPDCTAVMVLSHPAADRRIRLKVQSGVSYGRTGNVQICNSTLTFSTEDVDVETPV